MGDLDPHGHAFALLTRELLLEQPVEEDEVRHVLLGRLGQQRIEALGDVTEPKAREVVEDASMNEVGHDATSTMAW
jgi:hypothetical protein